MEAPLNSLLSPDQLADTTGMSVRTIYRLVADEKLPAYRAGRLLRFDLEEVLTALRINGQVAPGSVAP
jgi:excisionase family DNA binding protein